MDVFVGVDPILLGVAIEEGRRTPTGDLDCGAYGEVDRVAACLVWLDVSEDASPTFDHVVWGVVHG